METTSTVCKHCDASDSFNFGQCISCGEQESVVLTTEHKKFYPLTVKQSIVGVELVAEFIDYVNSFDDETYVADEFKESDYDDDDEIVTETVTYRSDIVGYLGDLLIENEEIATWNPHETLKFRYRNPLNNR